MVQGGPGRTATQGTAENIDAQRYAGYGGPISASHRDLNGPQAQVSLPKSPLDGGGIAAYSDVREGRDANPTGPVRVMERNMAQCLCRLGRTWSAMVRGRNRCRFVGIAA